ncbi:DUF6191 domain-containing protein [Streptomyces sp. SP18CS02]|uniref:DUF6191 domain-containing protein n=1 Tax=Streptomyces sp. SP18CS02 TaxID=3002531 RepID=UPI002E781B4E|nr:DUF6191 domain-containing protein [Streptomyces sp. SP18CS02]MEE1753002.1 DUF6191 domain-containing protein [Streptomyces sp. SP18CS02]
MAAAEHPLLRHGASSSIRHSGTCNRDDAESGAPPSSVDLDSGKAVIRPAQSATTKYDAP